MRILIVVDTINWCFAARASALQKYAPGDMEIDIVPYSLDGNTTPLECMAPWHRYDVIFCLPTVKVVPITSFLRESNISVPVIASHNSGVGRRKEMLLESILAADYTVINNYAAWISAKGTMPKSRFRACNISNGVDLTIFNVKTDGDSRPERVLWTASHSKAHDVHDIKGYETLLSPLAMIASEHNIQCDYKICLPHQSLNQHEMALWYNTGRYVACASTSEGTPNYLLEAVACGCVPVTVPVGNVPEFLSHGVSASIFHERNTGEAWNALKYARDNFNMLQEGALESIKSWDWSIRSKFFYDLFRSIAAGVSPEPFSYMERDRWEYHSLATTL
jgi:hypothetical protein